jgi:hypothetical protein
MKLDDFKFDGETHPVILARAAEFNTYIQKVTQENFIKIGVAGKGEPEYLPAILDSVEVSDALLVDEAESEGKSGSVKIISGWADCDVSVNLTLIDIPVYDSIGNITPNITRFDCLKEIAQKFKRIENNRPCVYTIQHPHIAAWGIRDFVFVNLKSSESRGKRIITCTLEFDEFDSASGKSQDRQLGVSQTAGKVSKSENPIVGDKTRGGLGILEDTYAKM